MKWGDENPVAEGAARGAALGDDLGGGDGAGPEVVPEGGLGPGAQGCGGRGAKAGGGVR